jgi:hypothetical protein
MCSTPGSITFACPILDDWNTIFDEIDKKKITKREEVDEIISRKELIWTFSQQSHHQDYCCNDVDEYCHQTELPATYISIAKQIRKYQNEYTLWVERLNKKYPSNNGQVIIASQSEEISFDQSQTISTSDTWTEEADIDI